MPDDFLNNLVMMLAAKKIEVCLLLIEPATPGSEGELFVHYNIAAPFSRRVHVLNFRRMLFSNQENN